jgi:hypothetical protein
MFVTLGCCWCIGLAAIMKSVECRSAISMGDKPKAARMSRLARRYATTALCVGFLLILVVSIIYGVIAFKYAQEQLRQQQALVLAAYQKNLDNMMAAQPKSHETYG